MKLRVLLPIVMALGGLTVSVDSAAADQALAKAQAAYNQGATLFEAGKYSEAAAKFKAAYQARPFAQFLFNIGACYEKLKEYEKAVDHYKRYLKADPRATDRKAIEKRIAVLERELKRVAKELQAGKAKPAQPSKEAKALGDAKLIRGLVVIESDPPGAYIYLDNKKGKALSRTPWTGSLEGEHTIYIERKGYKPVERRIQPDPKQLLVLVVPLAEQDYLGWVEITSNVPGANIYVDDKSVGVYNKTPFSGNMKPGTHTIWVHAEGYDWYEQKVTVVAGKAHKLHAQLKGSPVGFVNFRGPDIERTRIYLDGKMLCDAPPCRKAVPEGTHRLTIARSGYKSYSRQLVVRPKTETTVHARLAKKPGRGDAVWAYFFAAAFTGGGVWAALEARKIRNQLADEIALGNPPPDSNDPRFRRGKFFAIGADAAFALGGISFLTAIYYTFRDKGKPSTGSADVRALAVEPRVGPNYVGMEVSW